MEVAVVTMENAWVINDLLEQIAKRAGGGILGNARASLIDIKIMAEEAQRVFQESQIKKQ